MHTLPSAPNTLWEEHKGIRNAIASNATEFQAYPKLITLFVVTCAVISGFYGRREWRKCGTV